MAQKSTKKDCNLPLFKERFYELRNSKKMSQLEFAKFLKIPSGSVGGYESGAKIPNGVTLAKIATTCDVSVDYLLGISETQKRDPNLRATQEYIGLCENAIDLLHIWNDQIYCPEGSPEYVYLEILNSFLDEKKDPFSDALENIRKYTEIMKNLKNMYAPHIRPIIEGKCIPVGISEQKIFNESEVKCMEEQYRIARSYYFDAIENFKAAVNIYTDNAIYVKNSNEFLNNLLSALEKTLTSSYFSSLKNLGKEGATSGEHN
mgnify:CR=1 FL=1